MKVIYDKNYKVYFGSEVLSFLAQTLIEKSYSNVFVLVDENTEKHCLPLIKNYLETFEVIKISSGSLNKNLDSANIIWNKLQEKLANRNSVLINLGGGTLSDLGGFCASSYKRGIDFINVPTTLLAMVDAAIGGKQGIDLNNYKNLIGVFQHPKQIFIFPEFINTLPNTEKRSGMAELIKHALIDDQSFYKKLLSLEDLKDFSQIDKLIEKSAKIKLNIVNKDPLEKGKRKALNFGHTIGHAIETFSLINDKEPLKHGEAIAIGMICEAHLSFKTQNLQQKDFMNIVTLLTKLFDKYEANLSFEELNPIMQNDKKNNNDKINFTLLKKIGKASIDCNCSDENIREALDFYQNNAYLQHT
jgi:3-dehydroquinate synthase